MTAAIIVLAAGKGTRMKSDLPKVLHKLAGKTLIDHVLETSLELSEKIVVVVGHQAERVQASINKQNIQYVIQKQQLGTGHAVTQAIPAIGEEEKTLILYGDVPLISKTTLNRLLELTSDTNLGLLTLSLDDPSGYGRIVRDHTGAVTQIVEQKDANPEQLLIKEVNSGIIAIDSEQLKSWLPEISNQNVQQEYYLTDLVAIARNKGVGVSTCHPETLEEVAGVNDRIQLATLERYYQKNRANELMLAGNTLADPARFDCRGSITTGTDNYVDVNCVFEGKVVLGSNISIGPNCVLNNCTIADHVQINAHSLIEGSEVGEYAIIGPFARLRPGTKLAALTKVGNFVETKNTNVGKGSKINHLSYIGDATLGENVNVGAGTITCNYDGVNKHKTDIGDGAFIGSNASLVAPVTIGSNATVGAGSTITKQVNDNELALTRNKQTAITSWKRPEKKAK